MINLLFYGVIPIGLAMLRGPGVILMFLYVGALFAAVGDVAIANIIAYSAVTIVIGLVLCIVTLPFRR